MRNRRQHHIDIAIAKALELASPFLLPASVLKADAARLVVPPATETELADSIAHHDRERRLTSVLSETEATYKLSPAGVAWLAENP